MPSTDFDSCVLHLPDINADVERWDEYIFRSDFLTPCDSFSFVVGDPDIAVELKKRLSPGMTVHLIVNGSRICTGHIDEVSMGADRSGGTVFHVSGRDVLGDVVDSSIDPYLNFSPQQSLVDVATTVLTPFGLKVISLDNDADRSIRSANRFGVPVKVSRRKLKPTITRQVGDKTIVVSGPSQPKQRVTRNTLTWDDEKGQTGVTEVVLQEEKKRTGQPSKFLKYQAKPYPHEGAYEFLGRIAKRESLHIWAKADGTGVVIGKPEFDQEPTYRIVRKRAANGAAQNNVLSGSVRHSSSDQPSVIIAGARAGGGEFPSTTIRTIMVNELVSLDEAGNVIPSVQAIIKRFPKAYQITSADFDNGVAPKALNPYPRARPLFLNDRESNNLEQLINFTKREMASRQHRAVECSYTVAGHAQNGVTWAVDTIVDVDDDVAGIHEHLWVKSLEMHKSRSGGTTTTVTLIRPNTLRL